MCPKLGRIIHHQEVSTITQKKKRASKSGYKIRPSKQSRGRQGVKSTVYHAKSAIHNRQAQAQKGTEASNEYAVSQTQSAVEVFAHDGLRASGNAAKKLLQQEKVKSQTAANQRTQQSRQEFSASGPSYSGETAQPPAPSMQERGAEAFKKKVQSDLAAKKQEQPPVQELLPQLTEPASIQEPLPQPTAPIYKDRGGDTFHGYHGAAPRTRAERESASCHSPQPSVPSYQEQGRKSYIKKKQTELAAKRHPSLSAERADSIGKSTAGAIPSYQEQGRRSFIKRRGEELKRKAAQEPNAAISELPNEDGKAVSYSRTSLNGSEKMLPSGTSDPSTPALRKKDRSAPKKKPPFSIKTKASLELRTKQNTRPISPAKVAPAVTVADPKELGKKRFKKAAQKKIAQQARHGAAAVKLSQRLVTAAAKTVKAGVEMLAGLVGTGGLFVILCVVLLVGAVIASPFGIFFSNEPAEGAIPLSAAVAKINMEYYNRLNDLQTEEEYEEITLEGQPPDWVDVICVFACHVAGAQDGMDVAILDEERVDLLRETFWDMCTLEITVEEPEETIPTGPTVPTIGPTVPTEPPKPSLTIRIIAKTADEMRVEYSFTHLQNDALDMLMEESDGIDELIGSLDISQDDALGIISGLPEDTSDQRKEVVRYALSLVGKVNYFWGGKSLVIGWDSRWGQPTRVTAPGSPSTGTTRPYGMDCSGFVDWVFYNASGGSYVLGHGGGAATQHTYCTDISWSQAQPGDLVFYPGDSHVGIVGGRDENGNLLIVHCASGLNNVVITGQSGFTSIGRPMYFG